MIWLLRLVILLLLFALIYFSIKFFYTPKRKLESARKHKRFLLLDHDEALKNFHLTYNGVVFIGEKYLGPAKNNTEVVSISISPENPIPFKEFRKEDFHYIEGKILQKYPNASIHWKSHIQVYNSKNSR